MAKPNLSARPLKNSTIDGQGQDGFNRFMYTSPSLEMHSIAHIFPGAGCGMIKSASLAVAVENYPSQPKLSLEKASLFLAASVQVSSGLPPITNNPFHRYFQCFLTISCFGRNRKFGENGILGRPYHCSFPTGLAGNCLYDGLGQKANFQSC